MKKILLSGFLFCSLIGFATQEIPTPALELIDELEISEDWTEYTTIDGVKIEYRMKQCEDASKRAQNLLLFKFTNTTNQQLTISWATKEFRNGECWNCEGIEDEEYIHTMSIAPKEVIEGNGSLKDNKEFYIFGNFIKLVPGMTDQKLTDFELVNLTVR